MKVLLLNGSPHQYGCTYTALTEISETLAKDGIDSEIYWVGNRPISGCIACKGCLKTGKCVINDTVNEFIDKLNEADGLIVGSPVHYAGASGAVTSFLDRAFYHKSENYQGKPAAAIASCRRGGASATFDQLNKYFTICSMPVISSQYWNSVHGNTPDEVRQDLEGMQTMRTLARNMAWMLKCIKAGKDAGIDFPTHEAKVATNYIR